MRPLPLLTLLFALAFATAPLWSGQFDGFEAGQLPIPQEDPPIQPAGWAFAIWGVIYLGLVASAAFGLWRRAEDPDWDRVRGPLLASLVLGTPWLWVAQQSAEWATVLIVPMTLTAIAALLRTPDRDTLLLRTPVGLYAGWLTAATFVSLAALGAGYGVLTDALGWAFLGLPLALVVALAVLWQRPRAWAFAAAFAWALFGIAAKNGLAFPGVTLLALAGIATVAAVAWARGQDPQVA
ncbi:TspO/MBR family protein [Rubellimicrobium roseum]|uniref:Tryptophan-rich sensory protein n=1 Tax=Rubellimicrobium roseum TaxID=687525 RepID=A0A5C4NH78_9RHOB|nr:TspO/MBR family protein [Rubellimicrobium roseum]TNC73452.1 hypothetical protein FHG71_06310 [Rubellimicrobium roseum]